jgi:hypothetical protein
MTLCCLRSSGVRFVAAFECDPEYVATIRHNVSLNPYLARQIRLVDRALGGGRAHVRLDDCAYSPDGLVPDSLKVDVDGGEPAVLRSGERLLSEHRPSLIVETHSSELEQACGRLVIEHG